MGRGYRQLACAVLLAAVTDAKAHREDAIKFLTDVSGPWARSRAFWCQVADLDPEGFARLVKQAKIGAPAEGVSDETRSEQGEH